jgi:hypothetical protein
VKCGGANAATSLAPSAYLGRYTDKNIRQMENEILFINITGTIAGISALIGCNIVIIYSMIRQKLHVGNLFLTFNIMKGFSIKEWLLFVLLVVNFFIFASISANAYNSYLHEYGVQPTTWFF